MSHRSLATVSLRPPLARLSDLPRRMAVAVLALALAACGGGGDDAGAAPAAAADGGAPAASAPASDPPASAPTTATPPATGASGVASADGVPIDPAAFGGAMPIDEVEAALDRLATFIAAWKATRTDLPALTAQAYAAALVAVLADQPDARYVHVAASDFTVAIQLRDGTPYVVPTRFADDGSPRKLSAATASSPSMASRPAAARTSVAAMPTQRSLLQPQAAAQPGDPVLPTGRRALFLTAFPADAGHVENRDEVSDMFRSVGYSVEAGTMSVDRLINAAPADVMWLDTHGFDFEIVPAPNAAPVSTYVLAALPPPTCASLPAADCAAYRAMLVDGRAVRGPGFWGLAPRFVRNHVRLSSTRSLVVLDACEAADPFAGPTAMRSAFRAVGAGLVYGWVHQVWAPTGERVIREFFDTLLGTNRHYVDRYKLRPYQVQDVYAYLDRKGRMKDDYPGDATHEPGNATFEMSPLTLPPLAVAGLILRPSIRDFSIVEDAAISRITILGLFGDAGGTVTVNGQELLDVTWTPWKIEADLPNAGAGVAGPLVVRTNGIASAAVPISVWQGRAEETLRSVSQFGAPGFVATASCLATFRQNLLETRPNLESTPTRDSFGAFELQPIPSADLNRCTWSVSGEGREGDTKTFAEPAADAVTTQSPPRFTNLSFGVLPGGQVLTAFAVAMPMHYTSYDKDGKKFREGSFSIGFDAAELVRGTVLSPAWRFDASYQGPAGSDLRDSASFELHLLPQYLPSADTPR